MLTVIISSGKINVYCLWKKQQENPAWKISRNLDHTNSKVRTATRSGTSHPDCPKSAMWSWASQTIEKQRVWTWRIRTAWHTTRYRRCVRPHWATHRLSRYWFQRLQCYSKRKKYLVTDNYQKSHLFSSKYREDFQAAGQFSKKRGLYHEYYGESTNNFYQVFKKYRAWYCLL